MVIVDWSPFDRMNLGPEKNVPASDIQGIVADLDVRVNVREHRRRRRAGKRAETRREVLAALTELSTTWMPVRELELATLEFLDREARHTIEIRHTASQGVQVRRLLNPPLTIEMITVHARDWDRGYAAVGAVAGLAARSLILSIEPVDRELAELESSLYGIGLAIDRAGDLQTLTEPAPFMPDVFTTLAWQVAEQVYASGLERRVL
jgi:hypothetical protein